MKKHLTYGLLLALVITGCGKIESDNYINIPVTFDLNSIVTRTAISGNTTSFVDNDKICISSNGLNEDMQNAEFIVSNGMLSGEKFYYNGSQKGTFFAHFPHTAVYSDGCVKMTIAEDQGTMESFSENDFMTATSDGDPKEGGKVNLKFQHRLTLVKVIWKGSVTATSVTLKNVLSETTWNHTTNTTSTAGSAINVASWKISQDGQEYWALIPAQTVPAGTELIFIRDTQESFSYTTVEDIEFKENTTKKITLIINPDHKIEAIISNVEIEDWNVDEEDIEGSAESVPSPPVELIPASKGINISLSDGTKNDAAPGVWTKAVKTDLGNTITWDEDETAISMTVVSSKKDDGTEMSKWWENAVYFRPGDNDALLIRPGTYRLKFEAKADTPGKAFMIQVLKGDEASNTYFGIANTTDPNGTVTYTRTIYPSLSTADSYETFTFLINFNQIFPTTGNEFKEGQAGDYSKVLLTISVNTLAGTSNGFGTNFKFKNFEFIELK